MRATETTQPPPKPATRYLRRAKRWCKAGVQDVYWSMIYLRHTAAHVQIHADTDAYSASPKTDWSSHIIVPGPERNATQRGRHKTPYITRIAKFAN